MRTKEPKIIQAAEMCAKHQSLLVHQARYSKNDTWQAMLLVSQIVLFQAATVDDRTHKKIGDDISKISELGCLACYKPDAFGQVVEAAKTHDLLKIKALGEKWVAEKAKPAGDL